MYMNKTFGTFKDRILNLVHIFAPGLYRASQRTKVIFSSCAATAVIATIVLAARSCSRSAEPSGFAIHASALSGKDKAGNQWTIELLEGQPRFFYSSKKLKPGPPLLVSTSVEFKGLEAFIGLEVKGQAGEKYSGGALKNGKQVEAPKFDVVNEGGKILASGQFKYG
jgi:hypothetical protein